jgi:hypothetical protein
MRRPREVTTLSIAALGELIVSVSRCSHGDWNVLATGLPEKPIQELGASLGISEGGGNAENFQLRAAETERNRECVIDVISDIGVNDDFFRNARLHRLRPTRNRKQDQKHDPEARNDHG